MVFAWVKSIILNFWRSLFNMKKKKKTCKFIIERLNV